MKEKAKHKTKTACGGGNTLSALFSLISSGSERAYSYFRDNCIDPAKDYLMFTKALREKNTTSRLVDSEYIVIAKVGKHRSLISDSTYDAVEDLYIVGMDEINRFFIRHIDPILLDRSDLEWLNKLDKNTIRDFLRFNKDYRDIASGSINPGDKILIQGNLIMEVGNIYPSTRDLIHELARDTLSEKISNTLNTVIKVLDSAISNINIVSNDPEALKGFTERVYLELLTLSDSLLNTSFDLANSGAIDSKQYSDIASKVREVRVKIGDDLVKMGSGAIKPEKYREHLEEVNKYVQELINITKSIHRSIEPKNSYRKHIREFLLAKLERCDLDLKALIELSRFTPEGYRRYIELSLQKEIGSDLGIVRTPEKEKDNYSSGDFIKIYGVSKLRNKILSRIGSKLAREAVLEVLKNFSREEARCELDMWGYRVEAVGITQHSLAYMGKVILTRPQKLTVRHPEYGVRDIDIPSPMVVSFSLL